MSWSFIQFSGFTTNFAQEREKINTYRSITGYESGAFLAAEVRIFRKLQVSADESCVKLPLRGVWRQASLAGGASRRDSPAGRIPNAPK
jgi:hypothetical protein